ncbi:50S ribosomal protein L6 [endosymbiont GvMRE of Glomus versiforme]|uniref:50S ribosomal protein L6 n=1 Tax=endosymbiont GvMRE of Glomus versiforme TaxID=2039283 RepID=UPI000EE3E715|nr:50S ribosomal protein L6 [endosymbiont GvMRE of Glomus versiforme]RHZ37312.1 50S ribosomal protein L6 [endosymbiont GvMRE of Glomus versiforme]
MTIVNRILVIPENVQVIIKEKEQKIEVSGPRGKLELKMFPEVKVVQEGNKIFTKKIDTKRNSIVRKAYALTGTMNSLLYNALEGVKNGHSEPLVIKGVGYKVLTKAKKLEFSLGKSHTDELVIPEGLEVNCPDNTQIIIQGINKEKVGQFAAQMRKLRSHRPYKLKGVYYKEEKVKLKEGKAGINK